MLNSTCSIGRLTWTSLQRYVGRWTLLHSLFELMCHAASITSASAARQIAYLYFVQCQTALAASRSPSAHEASYGQFRHEATRSKYSMHSRLTSLLRCRICAGKHVSVSCACHKHCSSLRWVPCTGIICIPAMAGQHSLLLTSSACCAAAAAAADPTAGWVQHRWQTRRCEDADEEEAAPQRQHICSCLHCCGFCCRPWCRYDMGKLSGGIPNREV